MNENEYYIGQIFEDEYPPEAAYWCNNHADAYIAEIEPLNNIKRFEIKEVPSLTPEQERERVGKLTCTKREFALIIAELGITYSQLKELLSTNERAQLEWDLCTELVRNNPLLDQMASQTDITSEQLDNIFKFANGEIERI